MKFFRNIIISIVLISNLSAFTFDELESGYSFQKILYWAQDNNVPLCVDSYMLIPNGFKWSALKNKEKYRTFHYYDIIFNKKARIDLYFTAKSNELYKLKIRWNPSQELKETIISVLNKKYNSGTVAFGASLGENLTSRFKEWHPDKDTLLSLKSGMVGIHLTYTDLTYSDSEYKEKKKKKIDMIVKDASKF